MDRHPSPGLGVFSGEGGSKRITYPVQVRHTLAFWGKTSPIDAYPRIAFFDQTDNMGDLTCAGNVGLTHFLMKHLERSGNQKKKTHFVGLFFLTGLRPVLRLRRSTPSARCASGAPPSQLDRPCSPPDVPLTTGSTLRLSTYSCGHDQHCTDNMVYSSCRGNVGLTHFLMKHLVRSGKNSISEFSCWA